VVRGSPPPAFPNYFKQWSKVATLGRVLSIGAEAIYPEGHVPLHFPECGDREGHRVRAPVHAQRYKLIALFVKNIHNIALKLVRNELNCIIRLSVGELINYILGAVCGDYNSRPTKEIFFGAFLKSVTTKYM